MSKVQESRYWHYRTNDISDIHLERLKQVQCEWSFIGDVESGDIEKGLHRHAAFKFNRSYRDSKVIKEVCARTETSFNRGSSWYLEPKYQNSSISSFVKYVFKGDLNNLVHGDVSIIGLYSETVQEQVQDMDPDLPKKELTKDEKANARKLLDKERMYRASIGDTEWFRENDVRFMCGADYSRLLVWAQPDAKEFLEKLDNIYIYGPSCQGKSSLAYFLYGKELYPKKKNNEKWDSYFNAVHTTVLFDEMDSLDTYEQCMGGFEGIKEKCDVYPFPVRQNYGNRSLLIRPKRFIITSNFTPSQVFSTENKYGRKPQHIEMMLTTFNRRFKVIHIDDLHRETGTYFNQTVQRTFYVSQQLEMDRVIEEQRQLIVKENPNMHKDDIKVLINRYLQTYEEKELPSDSEMIPIQKKSRPAKPTKKVIV